MLVLYIASRRDRKQDHSAVMQIFFQICHNSIAMQDVLPNVPVGPTFTLHKRAGSVLYRAANSHAA